MTADESSSGDRLEGTAPTGREEELAPDERALLAAFDRLRPQGSLRWGFDDALRRVDRPDRPTAAEAVPWKGLPPDLWEHGRSARIGSRFVGDVTGVVAELMAEDARRVADAAVGALSGDRFVATWDALRYLSARVDELESRVDPISAAPSELDLPVPDLHEWADSIAGWCPPVGGRTAIVVGELADRSVLDALARGGRQVRGVDPNGVTIWEAFAALGGIEPDPGPPDLVLDEMADHLAGLPAESAAAVVLAGCVDRLDLATKVALVGAARRVTAPGGSIVVLASDQQAWDEALPPPARDLLPGRPLHPLTWVWLLEQRAGAAGSQWHRPTRGAVHAIVASVGP